MEDHNETLLDDTLPRGVLHIESKPERGRPFFGENARIVVKVDGEPICHLPWTAFQVKGKPGQAGTVQVEVLAGDCEVAGVG
jgi:hypothetical protein